jgi:hypothetical protein
MRAALLVAICLTLTGCVLSHAVAVGPPQPPKADDCQLQFAKTAPEELLGRYQRVGSVCVSGEQVLEHKWERAELQRRACALGGELVTASGRCSVGKVTGTEFAVMRPRPAAP